MHERSVVDDAFDAVTAEGTVSEGLLAGVRALEGEYGLLGVKIVVDRLLDASADSAAARASAALRGDPTPKEEQEQ
jgi:hypothetical protein